MAASNFPAVMEHVFEFEGGYVNDPRDPGGETNFGISKRSHPNENIAKLTKARAMEIYREHYWSKIRGDDLPPGIDLAVMDAAVNSGIDRGVRWMQQAVGMSGGDVDGKLGPRTLGFIVAADPRKAIKAACANRLMFLRNLRIWSTYSRGWTRRVEAVEATGLRMAADLGTPLPEPTDALLTAAIAVVSREATILSDLRCAEDVALIAMPKSEWTRFCEAVADRQTPSS